MDPSHHRVFPYFKIIEASRDQGGYYLKVNGLFEDGSIIFRWGIDEFTYKGIKRILQTRFFDNLPGLKYSYRILLTYGADSKEKADRHCQASIMCNLEDRYKDFWFDCSEVFASNIAWMGNIKSYRELEELEWK